MIRLFLDKDFIKYPLSTPPEWSNLQKALKQNLSLANAYNTKLNYLDNKNTLLRIMETSYLETKSIYKYIQHLKESLKDILPIHNVVQFNNVGDYISNPLTEKEIYVNVDFNKDIFTKEIYSNPIRVIKTDNRNTTIPKISSISGETIMEIDFILLMINYRNFKIKSTDEFSDVSQSKFIIDYVFSGLNKDFLNYSLFNKFIYKDYRYDRSEHPFTILNNNFRINKYIKDIHTIISSREMRLVEILQTLKVVDTDSYDILHLNNTFPSNLSKWVNWYSRVFYLEKLLELTKGDLNNSILSEVKLFYRLIKSSNITGVNSKNEFNILKKLKDK